LPPIDETELPGDTFPLKPSGKTGDKSSDEGMSMTAALSESLKFLL